MSSCIFLYGTAVLAGSDGTPLFLPDGSLYQGGSGKINVYMPPIAVGK
jgi:hypothetical protein